MKRERISKSTRILKEPKPPEKCPDCGYDLYLTYVDREEPEEGARWVNLECLECQIIREKQNEKN